MIEGIIVNAPIEVNLRGLRGTTMSMQKDGWQVAVETYRNEYNASFAIRLAAKHPDMNIKTMSMPFEMERGPIEVTQRLLPHIRFELFVVASEINFRQHEMPKFNMVDFSKPSFVPHEEIDLGKHFSLEECCFFRPLKDQADLYVPENKIWTIMEHLKGVRELQDDKQKEIRERMLNDRRKKENESSINNNYEQKQEIKLQLVSI